MSFYSKIHYVIECDSPECDERFEEVMSNGNASVRTAFIMRARAKGWKRAQRIGGYWDSYYDDSGYCTDYSEMTHKAWFCPECAKSGRIAEWHDMIKTEFPREVDA